MIHGHLSYTQFSTTLTGTTSLKTERTARKTYRSRDEARADVFDYIECFYNPIRRHSTLGYLSPLDFEKKVQLA